jgi:hypothetical protein
MIVLQKEPISIDSERKLRIWLSKPEANTLRRVITSECQFAQAAALQKALSARDGNASELLMQDDLRQAARFNTFLEILNEIAAKPKESTFSTVKLQPPAIANYGNTNEQDTAGD